MPRFALLLVGSSILLPLLIVVLGGSRRHLARLKSRQVSLVCLYMLAVAISSSFGAAPYVSILGSFENQMGVVTHLCFLVCFLGLVVGIGEDPIRFRRALWALALPGLLTALYAVAQSAGVDPFVSPRVYTFSAGGDSIIRAVGTLGHSDFLGNFLLYTTPLGAGLAFASRGRARRIALAGTALSVAAIVLSGTRGAWLGLGAGAVLFGWLEIKRARIFLSNSSKLLRAGLLLIIIAAIAALAVGFSKASRGIIVRAKSLAEERFTGAGRTVLWRDSIRMVPAHPLLGCGAEAFRKAFLPYKSLELVPLTQNIQNESSHNSYIDAAISYGLPGAIFYVALIVSSLSLLLRARRQATGELQSILLTGVACSFLAATVHKIFIFDQISTGLYFFALVALAHSASVTLEDGQVSPPAGKDRTTTGGLFRATIPIAVTLGAGLLVSAVWYSGLLLKADLEIRAALESAAKGNHEGLLKHGKLAADAPDPSGSYDFLFARALADYSAKLLAPSADAGRSDGEEATRWPDLDLALAHALKSARHGISPDASYILLCYLASEKRDYRALGEYAGEAVSLDPLYAPAHSFLAEADLAAGDSAGTERELTTCLSLSGRPGGHTFSPGGIKEFINSSRELAERGNDIAARLELIKARIAAPDSCFGCQVALAGAYERCGLYNEAIQAWQRAIAHDSVKADTKNARTHIDALERKIRQVP